MLLKKSWLFNLFVDVLVMQNSNDNDRIFFRFNAINNTIMTDTKPSVTFKSINEVVLPRPTGSTIKGSSIARLISVFTEVERAGICFRITSSS